MKHRHDPWLSLPPDSETERSKSHTRVRELSAGVAVASRPSAQEGMGGMESAESAPVPPHSCFVESNSEEHRADRDMQASADRARMSQEQLEHAMAARWGDYLRSNGKQIIGAMVLSMVSRWTEQVAGLATAQKATDARAVVTKVRESVSVGKGCEEVRDERMTRRMEALQEAIQTMQEFLRLFEG